MPRLAFPPALALFLVSACGDSLGRDTTASATQPTGATTVPVTTDGTGTSDVAPTTSTTTGTSGPGVTATSEPATTSDGPEPKFDAGKSDLGNNTTGAMDSGCKKVDFLFVIDNSASMEDNQKALIDSFPGFIDAIKNTLADVTDYHVMVVDTDEDGRCAQPCQMDADYVEFCSAKNYYACSAEREFCDTERGAGVLHPVGLYASNKKCNVFGGNRYMVPEEPDLLKAFACVAQVGTAGSPSERPMNSMQSALSEALNVPGGCNAGFLRDDAILVVTFLSDDPNKVDKGTPEEWKASVVAAKNGDESAVVVAGLIPKPDLGCALEGPAMGAHWQTFVDLWGDHGVSGSICEPNYAPFFEQAVLAIDKTCDEFNPPG